MKNFITITILTILLGLIIAIFGIESIIFASIAIVIFIAGATLEILALSSY